MTSSYHQHFEAGGDTKFPPSVWKKQDSAIPIVRIIPIVGSHFGNRIFLLVLVFQRSGDPLVNRGADSNIRRPISEQQPVDDEHRNRISIRISGIISALG